MATRTRARIHSSRIEDGRCTVIAYSNPIDGPQTETHRNSFLISELGPLTILNLAASGFATVVGNRCQRSSDHPDAVAVADTLWAEMLKGDWSPGKRDTVESEPTDLMKAVAEAANIPVHVVQWRFETEMVKRNDGTLYKDAANKPRRRFSVAIQRQLATDPAIAPIMARLAQERARALTAAAKSQAKEPSKLATMFTINEPDNLAAK